MVDKWAVDILCNDFLFEICLYSIHLMILCKASSLLVNVSMIVLMFAFYCVISGVYQIPRGHILFLLWILTLPF